MNGVAPRTIFLPEHRETIMGIIKEFKEFILKGNMIDLAVGLVIGAAFGALVTSFVQDVIMPPVGYAMGGVDFSAMDYELAPAMEAGDEHPLTSIVLEKDMPRVAISYGKFINACIALLIQGLAIFIVVKVINSMKRKAEEEPKEEPTPADITLLTEIRDALKNKA